MKKNFLRILPGLLILIVAMLSCTFPDQKISTPSFTPVMALFPVPSATITPISPSTPLSDDVWDRIAANGKIVVGMAWDYPPFSSVDSNFQVVGYDIALIQEIGKRLNIPIEIQNYPFEGLQGALQINQIDIAVAAISITPERATQMTFSPVYYIDQTAILARDNSVLPTITNVDQLAGYRVGVQRDTTYQDWIQRSLVDTGKMPADQMFSYIKAEDAVRDLQADRVDLVAIGLATAISLSNSQGGLKMAWQGFDQQDLAIAMRLGTPRLKAEIDRVMNDMLTDGTILFFIQRYIQDDFNGVLPTPIPPTQPTYIPLPPVPTAVPPACVDGMKFITDVTFGDNNMRNVPLLEPGEGFVKVWRLQNSGTCTWTPDYRLVYAYGNVDDAQMNGQPVAIGGNVPPGETADVGVTLVAPMTPYTYQGFWQMENSNGGRFGQAVWVSITTQTDPTLLNWQPTGAYCEVNLTQPDQSLTTNKNYDVVWEVKNISGSDWNVGSVDYVYVSGTEMHVKPAYDIQHDIKTSESGVIIVDMVAPSSPGAYSANWAIVARSTTLCNLMATVIVK